MNRRGFLASLGGAAVVGGATLEGWLLAPRIGDNAEPCDDLADCPTTDYEGVDRVVWYEDARGDGGVALVPATRSVSLPRFRLRVALRNLSARWVRLNPYGWSLLKRDDGRWHHLAPTRRPLPLLELYPLGRHRWSLAGTSEVPAPSEHGTATDDDRVAGLGGGRYAFAVAADVEGHSSAASTLFAVRLSVEGPPQSLSPSEWVVDVRREGDTVVVETDPEVDGDPATYALERTPAATPPPPRRYVTEQVLHRWPLRDALAHAGPAVDEIRVLGRTTSGPPYAVADPPWNHLSYDGVTWTESSFEGQETV